GVDAAGREECVQLAQHLRAEHDGLTRRVGYLHGGLPARVRHIVAQAFREGRLDVLVATAALDEEALPSDVRDVLVASLPSDRARFVEAFGGDGFGARPVAVALLFGADGVAAGRRERDAFEEFARWALRAGGFELLQAAAGQGGGA